MCTISIFYTKKTCYAGIQINNLIHLKSTNFKSKKSKNKRNKTDFSILKYNVISLLQLYLNIMLSKQMSCAEIYMNNGSCHIDDMKLSIH